MIPKFRAFWKSEKKMITDISWIRFDKEDLIGRIDGQTILPIGFSEVILMQSTGLFDKNGVEIFEGDVVKFNDTWNEYDYEGFVDGASEGENLTEIIKTEDGFSFGITKIPESSVFYFLNDEHMKFSEIVKSDDFSMVVIGNIHEHPLLLKE